MALSLKAVRVQKTWQVQWSIVFGNPEDEKERDQWTRFKRRWLGLRRSFRSRKDAENAIREFEEHL